MFYFALAYALNLSVALNKHIPGQNFTDSKCLFYVITKGPRTSEKRMMKGILAAQEGICDELISDIGFVRSSKNIADSLAKPISQALLRNVYPF